MSRSTLAAILVATLGWPLCAGAEDPAVVSIELPVESARFQPGPGYETTMGACMTCHSADYVYVQPPLTAEQWRREVLKMRNVFGAPFAESDIDAIVAYLVTQNGAP